MVGAASTLLTISGITVDVNSYVILRCATGASFKDKAAVRSTALYYDATKGVAARVTANYLILITVAVPYTRIDGLQLRNPKGRCIDASGLDKSVLYTNLIAECTNDTSIIIALTQGSVLNCLIVVNGDASSGAINGNRNGGVGCTIEGNTIINRGAAGSSIGMKFDNYGSVVVKDNAVFGFNTCVQYTGSASSSSNNATDLATGFGSANQTSLTFASQFVSTTNDFRALSTGSLYLNGTPDATNIPTDITGTTRNASTPTIGAWEVIAAIADILSFKYPKVNGKFIKINGRLSKMLY